MFLLRKQFFCVYVMFVPMIRYELRQLIQTNTELCFK
jgi:hypothetical protein